MPVETRLYDVLGVPPNASEAEIRKAYKKLVLKHHPDKGGDRNKFQEITTANEVLTNKEKRQIYDEHGSEGLKEAEQGGDPGARHNFHDPEGLFNFMFGRRGGPTFSSNPFGGSSFFQNFPRKEPRPQTTVFRLKVDLEDVFRGTVRKVAVNRTVACQSCSGRGSARPEGLKTCQDCRGRGVVIMERRSGGLVQRSTMSCPRCRGTGSFIAPEDICQPCKGEGKVVKPQVYIIEVPQGAKDGDRLPMKAENAQDQTMSQPDDVVCILSVLDHPRFQRAGDDLLCLKPVPLETALCGAPFLVETLGGGQVHVACRNGDVIQPDSWWKLPGEGMTVARQPGARGNLIIKFQVVFPDSLTPEAAQSLLQSLRRVAGVDEEVAADDSEHAAADIASDDVDQGASLLKRLRQALTRSLWGAQAVEPSAQDKARAEAKARDRRQQQAKQKEKEAAAREAWEHRRDQQLNVKYLERIPQPREGWSRPSSRL
mmetsp:Transcript_67535/g.141157  ORF Transcript_67535/g.141157 Transcript_67535/m.141157 type:complete len:484 (-) Transcript_67535:442-1893(-)|eukprot:CAMPEP_0206467976 /NCGR_PEP_ID=MMETSP0324_2-20121206/29349_1 /ASSEMBLY_ACC=CAM_ASM_000836 /TAXON_ID=2866 /ORGANISM="Crypthecodinium cohnii, Strain Seligo" /LENGTH=483 /DNA_ID=CAMNT_0053941335 /DNA_START=91 /DNA_END=1542 /DNA_ORIENTATION=-